MAEITLTYDPAWRSSIWPEQVPARPGWFVTCPDHPKVGKDDRGEPWGYAREGDAKSVVTRHRKAYHGG